MKEELEIPVSKRPALLVDVENELNILEQKASFLAMATSGLGMLSESDLDVISSANAWAGLGWYSEEIAQELRKINARI